MKIKYVAYLLTFIAGIWGGNELYKRLTHQPEAKQAAQAMVNKKVTDFTLNDISGKPRNLHEWEGNVIVLNFWATWCPPCRKETPMFVELQDQYGAQGLQFVGVAIDDIEKVKNFMDTYGVNYPMLIGTDDAIAVAKEYGNRFGALPYTVVIDRSGRIVLVKRGELTQATLEDAFRPLL